jgi:hypothetical protein
MQTSCSHSFIDAYRACSLLNLIPARSLFGVHSPLRRYAITYARLRHFIFSSPRNTLRIAARERYRRAQVPRTQLPKLVFVEEFMRRASIVRRCKIPALRVTRGH